MHQQATAYYGCEIQEEGRGGEARPWSAGPTLVICLEETQEYPPFLVHVILYNGSVLTERGNSTQK